VKARASFAVFFCIVIVCSAGRMSAQACPPDDGSLNPGEPTTLTGTIRIHSGLRPWTGLEVSPKVCGQGELQLTFIEDDSSPRYRQTVALAGCGVQVKGSIEISPTAHYSANMYIQDAAIVPDASCHPKAVSVAPSETPIPSDLQSYRASVFLDFGDTSKPMRGTAIRADGNAETLTPWQNYVST
jgi:hypothetical protein